MYGIESCAEPLYQLILTKDGFNKNSLIYINIMKLGEIMGFFFHTDDNFHNNNNSCETRT